MGSLAFLLALLISQPASADTIDVHEWGVVLYGAGSLTAVGSPSEDPLWAVCVDAPVLFFHGAPFTGDVTVGSLGEVVSPYPEPDAATEGLGGLGTVVRWEGLTIGPDGTADMRVADREEGQDLPGYGWATGYWRVAGASWVQRGRDGFRDRFLYYEVELTDIGFPIPLPGYSSETLPDSLLFAGEILEYRRGPDGFVGSVQDQQTLDVLTASDESDMPWDGELAAGYVPEEVRAWAGDLLTEEELGALWATWEPYVLYGDWPGDRLLVFPIPESLLGNISRIIVRSDGDLPVTFHRFFLGMLSVEDADV